jgi:hypothetical protein
MVQRNSTVITPNIPDIQSSPSKSFNPTESTGESYAPPSRGSNSAVQFLPLPGDNSQHPERVRHSPFIIRP